MRVVTPAPRVKRGPLIATVAVLLGLILLAGGAAGFYTELLWYRETRAQDVFTKGITTRLGLGMIFGALFAVVLLVNLWIVRRITSPGRLFSVPDQVVERYRATMQPYVRWAVVGGAVLLGLFAGSGASVEWRDWLLYQNAVPFGREDPVFGKDVSFYVFKLPFYRFLFAWAFSSLIVITIVTALGHYLMGGIRPQSRTDRVSPEVRAHLSVLLGAIVLLKAWGYRLDQYDLLYSERGVVTGASYTDVNAQLPALRLLVVIAIACAVFFFVNVKVKNWMLPIAGLGLLALMSLVAGGIYPAAIQRLRVAPNEIARESPYIKQNIEHTRAAFALENVRKRTITASESLAQADLRRNASTVENIRLWDPGVLQNVLLNVQRIRPYYEFFEVDVDRYEVGGERRQVMLSARELDVRDLVANARTWVNEHLVYTHGYGLVATRVDRVDDRGQPSFVISDIPGKHAEGMPELKQPRIYYGEADATPFVVVGTKEQELDYPIEGDRGFAPTRYTGKGGIQMKGLVRRAAFAWRFRDPNLVLTGALTDESKILFGTNIFRRAEKVAPFLRFDRDPYPAIVDGRIVWFLDGYTTTTMFPYSERVDLAAASRNGIVGAANYMRNSVKVLIDAEHGTVDIYRWDEQDPILRAWDKIFPGLMRPKTEMPAAALPHVRYPEGMFNVQSSRYGLYHITDPNTFYGREDAWRVAKDPDQSLNELPAYYLLMRLPGESELSFVLVRPFTPNRRENLSAYMVADSDPDQYGVMTTFVIPKSGVVNGPAQVRSLMLQDPDVSQLVTLLGQQDSEVVYGNLLLIPIEGSLMYVQPLYVQGRGVEHPLPELKRVIVLVNRRVIMRETLPEALRAAFGGRGAAPTPDRPDDRVDDLVAEALEHYEASQQALREGDFETYGREQERMAALLRRAAEQRSPSPSPSPSP